MDLIDAMQEYEEECGHNTPVLYHGTSNIFRLTEILPPRETGNLREEWRRESHNWVFLTDSPRSAYKYALKACEKYGGSPVVYEVEPVGEAFYRHTHEHIARAATVIQIWGSSPQKEVT